MGGGVLASLVAEINQPGLGRKHLSRNFSERARAYAALLARMASADPRNLGLPATTAVAGGVQAGDLKDAMRPSSATVRG